MYRVTIAICLASALLCAAYLPLTVPVLGTGVLMAATQIFVYLIIAGVSRLCRGSAKGSGTVLAVMLPIVALSFAICRSVPPTVGYMWGFVFFWPVAAQLIMAVLGCYVGYMFVEFEKSQRPSPSSIRGKLAVILVLAGGMLAVVFIAAAW